MNTWKSASVPLRDMNVFNSRLDAVEHKVVHRLRFARATVRNQRETRDSRFACLASFRCSARTVNSK